MDQKLFVVSLHQRQNLLRFRANPFGEERYHDAFLIQKPQQPHLLNLPHCVIGVTLSFGPVVERHSGARFALAEEAGRSHPWVGELHVFVKIVQT